MAYTVDRDGNITAATAQEALELQEQILARRKRKVYVAPGGPHDSPASNATLFEVPEYLTLGRRTIEQRSGRHHANGLSVDTNRFLGVLLPAGKRGVEVGKLQAALGFADKRGFSGPVQAIRRRIGELTTDPPTSFLWREKTPDRKSLRWCVDPEGLKRIGLGAQEALA